LALILSTAAAGAQEYSFQYYGVDQGLTDLAVRSLFQDSKGFLWLSTENGIFRYDGARFQSYGKDEGFPPSNGVLFGEAPDGSLLAGGRIGLYRLTANQFRQVPLPGNTTVSWGSGIRSDGSGRTYIGTEAGLILADIDHFKSLNDAAGHQKGDECLKLVAAELAIVGKRATDLVARIGGEEFAILLREGRNRASLFKPSGGKSPLTSDLTGQTVDPRLSPTRATGTRGA
jgi:ligand-binding sensor domain-containing protein